MMCVNIRNSVLGVNIPVVLNENFSLSINNDKFLYNKINNIAENMLNDSIVDYEKIYIEPEYLDKEIEWLVFDLEFKEGVKNWDKIFDVSDIKFQKSNIKKSFIRSMYYDNNNVLDQNLISVSTIFMNSGLLYHNLTINKDNLSQFIIPNVKIKDTLLTSEGFRFYTFKDYFDIYNNDEISFVLYNRIEFNNAKHGTKHIFVPNVEREMNMNTIVDDINIPLIVNYNKGRFTYTFKDSEEWVVYNEENKTLTVKLKELWM